MCTLSVLVGHDGYLLAMNRDEKIARGPGVSAKLYHMSGVTALYPGDGAGGTWIGVNQYGNAFALLNWNDVVAAVPQTRLRQSRGQVIPVLIGSATVSEANFILWDQNLQGMPPFRLIGVFPALKQIREWRWDSARIEFSNHAWELRHWFSSSLSDKQAESLRGQACRDALDEADAGSRLWLRRLHASHMGGRGPFSLCVHREDVETLSYSEIECTPSHICFHHFRGSPCDTGRFDELRVERSTDRRAQPAIAT
jgi:hypothetical protein